MSQLKDKMLKELELLETRAVKSTGEKSQAEVARLVYLIIIFKDFKKIIENNVK